MKLKKIIGAALLSAMTLSSVSALAVNVPTPANNDEAYRYAEAFYHDGYYYEAQAELNKVNTNDAYYDANKQAAWLAKVNAKINDLIYKQERAAIAKIIADAKALNSKLDFNGAYAVLQQAAAYNITPLEYEKLLWWENAVLANMANPKYGPAGSAVRAIQAVKDFALQNYGSAVVTSVYEHLSAVKVPGGYDVYVKTRTPGGTYVDVAAFNVRDYGVNRAF